MNLLVQYLSKRRRRLSTLSLGHWWLTEYPGRGLIGVGLGGRPCPGGREDPAENGSCLNPRGGLIISRFDPNGQCLPRVSAGNHAVMKNATAIMLGCFAIVLASSTQCYAHALAPAYYPLGPHGLLFVFQTPACILPVLAVIVIHAFILQRYLGPATLLGASWRAVVVLILSKVAESVPTVMLLAVAPWRAWSSDSTVDTVGIPALIFAVGLAANVLAIGFLYRRSAVSWNRVVAVSVVLSTTCYFFLLLSGVVIV